MFCHFRNRAAGLLAAAVVAFAGLSGLFADASLRPAHAQEMMVEFRETLGAYGRWVEHPRWGAVWVPDGMPGDWRPYRVGHWVYTDEWGWYWVAEEEWGWIAYHYGRWVFDRDLGLGWVWVPGSEWSPAWVSWRRGEDAIGWAPMPPDEVYVSVQDEPDYWLFVRAPDIVAPSLAIVILPAPQAILYVRQTVIINQTVIIRDRDRVICANPGVPPSYVAARIGRPIQTVSVEPHVVRGTVGGAGAVGGAPRGRGAERGGISPQKRLIQPAANIPPPTPFRAGQRPQLGPDAPNALKRANLAPSGPTGPGGSGPQGGQPGAGRPSPAISSRPPSTGPNRETGPRLNQPTGPANLGAPSGPDRSRRATSTPGGTQPGTNQPPSNLQRDRRAPNLQPPSSEGGRQSPQGNLKPPPPRIESNTTNRPPPQNAIRQPPPSAPVQR